MVPLDRRQNFLLSFPGTVYLTRVFLELRRKIEISENESPLLWQHSLKNQKSMFRLIVYSHSRTERWNRVKIRPVDWVEAEIKWLIAIVKNKLEKQDSLFVGATRLFDHSPNSSRLCGCTDHATATAWTTTSWRGSICTSRRRAVPLPLTRRTDGLTQSHHTIYTALA